MKKSFHLALCGVRRLAVLAIALASASCASIGSPAVWADGDVRELHSNKPIAGATVILENIGSPPDLSNTDESNAAGHFSVFQAVSGERRAIPILVVADGFKPAEFSVPVLQSNTLLVRLAANGSREQSRIEYMAALPGDGSGADADCGSD
jgi:hypothetical protein